MIPFSRRNFMLTGGAGLLAACNNGVGSRGAEAIDARVDATLNFLYSKYPESRTVADKSVGMLVMPLVTKAGFGIGGAFGRGALRVGGATVDYYSAASATVGFQIGAQQYAHVLFFMTEEALTRFRRSSGYTIGGDLEYTFNDNGENISADLITSDKPVIPVIFGQAGLIAGATLKGTKYTRIIP